MNGLSDLIIQVHTNLVKSSKTKLTKNKMNILKAIIKLPFRLLWLILDPTIRGLYWILAKILPSRQTCWKVFKWQLLILHAFLTIHFAHQVYAFRCGVNGQIVGYFMRHEQCNDLFLSYSRPVEDNSLPDMAPNNKQALETWDVPVEN